MCTHSVFVAGGLYGRESINGGRLVVILHAWLHRLQNTPPGDSHAAPGVGVHCQAPFSAVHRVTFISTDIDAWCLIDRTYRNHP